MNLDVKTRISLRERICKLPEYGEDIRVSITNALHPEPARADQLLSIEQSLEKLDREPKSFIRLCDGECNIMTKAPIYFQRYHPELRRGLFEILRRYQDGRDCPYHLALPGSILRQSRAEIEATGTLYIWRRSRHIYFRHARHTARCYLEAQLFKLKNREHYDAILRWLTRADQWFVVNNRPELARHHVPDPRVQIYEIKIKPYHVFEHYQEVLDHVRSILARSRSRDNQVSRVLVGAGPCGKLLIRDLARDGVIGLDMGKFFHSQRIFAATPIPENTPS